MKKIKVMRASGHPLKLEDIEAYKQDWKELFDKVQRKCSVGINAEEEPAMDMLRMQKLLGRCELILQNKYSQVGEWDFLATEEQMLEAVKEHGNIMLTKHRHSDELLYVILDEDMIQGA